MQPTIAAEDSHFAWIINGTSQGAEVVLITNVTLDYTPAATAALLTNREPIGVTATTLRAPNGYPLAVTVLPGERFLLATDDQVGEWITEAQTDTEDTRMSPWRQWDFWFRSTLALGGLTAFGVIFGEAVLEAQMPAWLAALPFVGVGLIASVAIFGWVKYRQVVAVADNTELVRGWGLARDAQRKLLREASNA